LAESDGGPGNSADNGGRMKKHICALALSVVLLVGATRFAAAGPISFKAFQEKPKLVLVLVFDQFRADYLTRFHSRFLPARQKDGKVGGFGYLMAEGAYYPQAEFSALQNMTCPGHAAILSGASPYQTRISTNLWFDQKLGRVLYCVEDAQYPVIAEKKTKYPGLSPTRLSGSTVGDELKNAGHPSKVVTVALKDRSAIMLGGHRADLALWFDEPNFGWTSSRYYLREGRLPDWMKQLNQDVAKQKGQTATWVAGESNGLSVSAGSTFPTKYQVEGDVALKLPTGVKFTTQAALAAMEGMGLGKGAGPDLLAVSYSTHDYAGHEFGAESRQMEEMTVVEDRSLAELLNAVDRMVPGGLAHVLIVLTADHGIAHNPTEQAKAQVESGLVEMKPLAAKLESRLIAKFGKPSGKLKDAAWIAHGYDLNFWLNQAVLDQRGAKREVVENFLKALLLEERATAFVVTQTEVEKGLSPPGLLGAQVLRSYVPGRNGSVVMIPKPNYFQSASGDMVGHMTGYSYDRTVPLILTGKRFTPGVYGEKAAINDLAVTLSFLLGVIPPSGAEGRVLAEALR
jgi:predicted AlkP superfamily pyrophosphatase or phosphodiesterase